MSLGEEEEADYDFYLEYTALTPTLRSNHGTDLQGPRPRGR